MTTVRFDAETWELLVEHCHLLDVAHADFYALASATIRPGRDLTVRETTLRPEVRATRAAKPVGSLGG